MTDLTNATDLQVFPFSTTSFDQVLIDALHEARSTKNYWALTETMRERDTSGTGLQTNPNFVAAFAWAYIRMVETGVHIDDVADDARTARDLMVRAKPLFPEGKFPPRIGDLMGEIHFWLQRAEAFEAEQGI
jgi:hypothetical protein